MKYIFGILIGGFFIYALPAQLSGSHKVHATGWNETGINWMSYDEGLASAKQTGKPIMVQLKSENCGACRALAKTFHSSKIESASQNLTMIMIDTAKQKVLAGKYNIDGGYIPRTFFLDADGNILPGSERFGVSRNYRYFFSAGAPGRLTGAMQWAAKH